MTHRMLGKVNLDLLYPPFMELLLECLASVKGSYKLVSGYRSPEEQDEIYAQGRTKPGAIVTKAKGGQSQHNFGLAVDFAPNPYTADEKAYYELGQKAEELGLHWGASYNDFAHIGWPGFVNSRELRPLLKVYQTAKVDKLKAVWTFLSAQSRR